MKKSQKTQNGHNEPELIGSAAFVTKHWQMAQSMKNSAGSILITGEPGTGKTHLAHYLCYHCASAPKIPQTIWLDEIEEALLEHELFGYFDENRLEHEGKILSKSPCSVILKNIEHLPLHLQAKVLHMIETREFARIGGEKFIKVDTRVICTTSAQLPQLVVEKRFRQDLYYLLSAGQIVMQPLRKRKADIKALGQYFLLKAAHAQNKRLGRFTAEALNALKNYAWPGNVRELKAEIEQLVALAEPHQQVATAQDISAKVRFQYPPFEQAQSTRHHGHIKSLERQRIIEAIEKHGGNKSAAARALGIKHRTFYQKMKSLGIPLDVGRNDNG